MGQLAGLAMVRCRVGRKGGRQITGRLAVMSAVAVIGLAGCAGPGISRSAQPSEAPTVVQSAVATPSPTPPPTPMPTPTPTPRVFTFTATGSMREARMDATATLLQNGKVLIAGGAISEGSQTVATDSAELYDPATGKFARTGSLATERVSATATLLTDGRVLIAGGSAVDCGTACGDNGEGLVTAEIYNPATGKFSRTGSMSQRRVSAAAVRLNDGRVLVFGGSSSAEIYDPKTGKFTRMATLPAHFGGSIFNHAFLLSDGKVMMFGTDDDGPAVMSFDPATGKFTHNSLVFAPGVAASEDNDGPQTATLLKDGRILLTESGYLEMYDPATGAVTDSGTVSVPGDTAGQFGVPTATLLADGRVLIAGGYDSSASPSTPINLAFLYDLASGLGQSAPMLSARYGQTATLLPNGSVLIVGGSKDSQNAIKSAELFK